MSQTEAVLFANDAFYLAFNAGDMEAMGAVWAEEGPLACIHPGWPVLLGREAVLKSWRSILANPDAPQVTCRSPRVLLLGETALVLCYEDIAGALLAASNVFCRDRRSWKMVHHQAGPCQHPPELERELPERSLQ